MKASDYHAIQAVSASLIKTLLQKSPLHAWLDSAYNPNRQERNHSAAMLEGTAAHAYILEGRDMLTIVEANDFRTKSAQEARDEAISQGRIPKLVGKADEFYLMCDTAQESIESMLGFKQISGDAEHSIQWEASGQPCKSRLDWVSGDRQLILDLKITELSSPAAFQRSIAPSGYDVQSAFYRRAVKAKYDQDARFVFCVIEAIAPYPVYFLELSPTFEAISNVKIERALQLWGACTSANTFPCYPSTIQRVEPPNWELTAAEEIDAETHGFDKEAFLFGSVRNKK